ncbi:GNAT family N-acetyltransferase [Moraxella sp.]|uniref:GNAT family N-acetyltransferase n=1 Tax=Moraxella sp. TaxID=479 RepID=UPI0026DCFD00|nr:GNAT family N-acetyltransferase [Moraxella sp.]MDO4894614.1 GNAT family N-acetyltransferase [Moraxella sp.]
MNSPQVLDLPILSYTDEQKQQLAYAIAQLEQQVLPEDAWHDDAINEMFGQFGVGVLAVYATTDKSVNQLIGYCLYQSVFELAEIHRIGTMPSFARQGVATALLQALFDKLGNDDTTQRLLLEVRADNAPAIALYTKMGFEQIDCRIGYYQTATGRIDALILQHSIK